MKKFTDISNKETSLDFKKEKQKTTSNDIENLDDQISKEVEGTKLDGEWEIVNIIDVSTQQPKLDEAIIINAELGSG